MEKRMQGKKRKRSNKKFDKMEIVEKVTLTSTHTTTPHHRGSRLLSLTSTHTAVFKMQKENGECYLKLEEKMLERKSDGRGRAGSFNCR